MINNQYDEVCKNLASLFKFKLTDEDLNGFALRLKGGLEMNVEPDKQRNLVLGIKLGIVNEGRYRDMILKQALRANDSNTQDGVLSYLNDSKELFLFYIIDVRTANEDRLKAILIPFVRKARQWSESIQRGEIPILESSGQSRSLFGLIH